MKAARKFHTLDFEYNGEGPFTAVSLEPGWLSIELYNSSDGFVHLDLKIWEGKEVRWKYSLETVKPGDRLKFSYDTPNNDHGTSVDKIVSLNRTGEAAKRLTGRNRLGLDTISSYRPEPARLSYPENGGFSLMLANIPRDHARCWISAGNEAEEWTWQLDDLYAGDWIEFQIVETDWCDAFPNVSKPQK
jgi:hypothetical protein